jgi:hypothetical protein
MPLTPDDYDDPFPSRQRRVPRGARRVKRLVAKHGSPKRPARRRKVARLRDLLRKYDTFRGPRSPGDY